VDKHFPHLTVGQTLEFAAAARTPQARTDGVSRKDHVESIVQVVMAMCGLTHTRNTKVGNDFIRGVSGGERKRVSIAEMIVAGSSVCAWDNSTRGLDSATAFKFVHNLRIAADLGRSTHVVAIYQASQAIYDIFDKATVLYEGRQIYFGRADEAKSYFERMGWVCPTRQTTADFLTAVTNPMERIPREGMENKVPKTAEEFEAYWKASPEFQRLQAEIDAQHRDAPADGDRSPLTKLRNDKSHMQSKHVRPGSSYIISIPMQVSLATTRAYRRIWNDKSAVLTQSISNIIIALIVGSLYYGGGNTTSDATSKVSTLFIAILCNALTAVSEIAGLYLQRPIVEKQASYRFIHPACEAIAGIASDIPIKFIVAVCFNLVLYFLAGLRREAGNFFLFFLVSFISTFVMSAVFRTMAAITKTIAQAMTLAGVLILALVIYTGFVIAPPQMHPWFGWIRWINPIYYAFEILVANEFHNVEMECSTFVPGYPQLVGDSFVCSSIGAVAGRRTVNGDAYIAASYRYSFGHVWRNFGILCGLLLAFMFTYFVCIELNSSTTSTAEMLVFQRGKVPRSVAKTTDPNDHDIDAEATGTAKDHQQEDPSLGALEPQKSVFTWRDVKYDIQLKGETRTLLDNVSGWVKPGTLTALMGVSGAGKTTLLDVLAQRVSMGVITGDMFVNGKPLDDSFQRKTGYVQQQGKSQVTVQQ
jgi:ABC-type multidrug transport system ATPase subunit